MTPRGVRLLAATGMLGVAVALHLVTCAWTVRSEEDARRTPPLVVVNGFAVADEQARIQFVVAQEQYARADAELERNFGGRDVAERIRRMRQEEERGRFVGIADQHTYWRKRMDDLGPRAFGKAGLYPRGSLDGALAVGMVVPAVFVVGAIFMAVWAVTAGSTRAKAGEVKGGEVKA